MVDGHEWLVDGYDLGKPAGEVYWLTSYDLIHRPWPQWLTKLTSSPLEIQLAIDSWNEQWLDMVRKCHSFYSYCII